MNISSLTAAPATATAPKMQRAAEASEGMRPENDRDSDDAGLKSSAAAQPFVSKPTATMGNHVNVAA